MAGYRSLGDKATRRTLKRLRDNLGRQHEENSRSDTKIRNVGQSGKLRHVVGRDQRMRRPTIVRKAQ